MDIVERLRSFGPDWTKKIMGSIVPYEICANAADRIESDAKVIAALRERLECSEPWRAAGFGPAAEVAELRHRIEKLERIVRYLCPNKNDDI